MLGDVGQSQLVDLAVREISFDEIIRDGRPWLAIQAPLFGKDRPDTLKTAEALAPVLAGDDALSREFIGDEPIPERGVVRMDLQCDIDQVGISPVPFRYRARPPTVIALLAELQYRSSSPSPESP